MAKDYGAAASTAQTITSGQGVTQFVGTPAARPAVQTARLRVRANANFLLVHYPWRWMFIRRTGEWLPCLGRMSLDPGVGGVDKTGDDTLARAARIKKGGVVLPPEWAPDGVSYVQAIPAEGGMYHCTVWERPQMVGSLMAESVVNTEAYYEWMRGLIRDGRIPRPADLVLDELARRYETGIETLEKRPGTEAAVAEHRKYLAKMREHVVLDEDGNGVNTKLDADQIAAQIAALQSQLAKLEQPAEPAKPAKAPKAAKTEPA